jgi:hypothetical protein
MFRAPSTQAVNTADVDSSISGFLTALAHQENQKKTYLPLLTYCLSALDQVH